MKFRSVMIDAGPMREFTNIVSTISKLSKECILRLSSDQIFFIVCDENSGPAPPILWCEIPQAMFFSEYQLIGLDDDHKDIYLGLTSDRMRSMASEVVIRASAEGRLTLQIKTDMAKVSTRFRDLRVESFGETQNNEDTSRVCCCRVDAKKLSMFLSADMISHNRTIASVVHKKLVVLCLHTDENVKLQCFISGIVY
ncbi:Checkpoint protein HUS1 [Operophtera brumata]|uniref:Checkpoint protein n=1 Tax=Operophtera brumata TaxID=104452 RepID=A0A0L7LHC7_OPEBR|nr:Checkpoint protein HUS1 [Operophtera brumata]